MQSKRVLSAVAVTDPEGILNGRDKYLAVANFSGPGGVGERGDNLFRARIRHENLDFYLRQEIDFVFHPAIHLGVAFLTAVATHFRDCDALHSQADEGLFYFV